MSEQLYKDLAEVLREAREACQAARAAAELSALKNKYLGRQGILRKFTGMLGAIRAPEEKAAAGKKINETKQLLEACFNCSAPLPAGPAGKMPALQPAPCSAPLPAGPASVSATSAGRRESAPPPVDVTLPGTMPHVGRRHPVYVTMEDICATFGRMGFGVEVGPEIETSYNNFEALNIPADHPSRDCFDTFYLQGGMLLRSHTSPVQIRVMKRQKPPVRIVVPGKVFRPDAPDASHSPMFHQVEGLMVDEGVSFADLKGVLTLFARDYFGADVRMRFRPSYFPFTEPSAEVDISCLLCGGNDTEGRGAGCPVCKYSGWVEILGAGMVHPKVLENVGYDTERYSGFAFGMGVERVAMLKYQIDDIRLFTENNMAFLQQF